MRQTYLLQEELSLVVVIVDKKDSKVLKWQPVSMHQDGFFLATYNKHSFFGGMIRNII
jgi:hypothetical protein